MQKMTCFFVLFLSLLGFFNSVSYANDLNSDDQSLEKGIQILSVQQLTDVVKEKKAIVVDARSNKDYKEGHVPGAISIPVGSDAEEIHKALPDQSAHIAVYCANVHCPAGGKLAKTLIGMGYKNVSECPEGYQGWQDHTAKHAEKN